MWTKFLQIIHILSILKFSNILIALENLCLHRKVYIVVGGVMNYLYWIVSFIKRINLYDMLVHKRLFACHNLILWTRKCSNGLVAESCEVYKNIPSTFRLKSLFFVQWKAFNELDVNIKAQFNINFIRCMFLFCNVEIL